MKRSASTFLVLIIFISYAFGQSKFEDGLIITNTGDTIRGFVQQSPKSNNYNVCVFKNSENAPAHSFTPQEINGYGIQGLTYFEAKNIVSSNKDEERLFLQVLVEGEINLYKSESSFYAQKGSDFYELVVERKQITIDGELKTMKDNKYIGILRYMMADCPQSSSQLNDVQLNERALQKVVDSYNKCVDPQYVKKSHYGPKIKVGMGLAAGVNYSSISFKADEDESLYLTSEYDNSFKPIIGLGFNVMFPKTEYKTAIHFDVLFTSYSFHTYNEQQTLYYHTKNDVTLKFFQMKIPIGFRFALGNSNFAPTISLGLSNSFNLNSDMQWTKVVEFNGETETTYDDAFIPYAYQPGGWLGAGMKQSFKDKYELDMELRFEILGDMVGGQPASGTSSYAYSTTMGFHLLVGFGIIK